MVNITIKIEEEEKKLLQQIAEEQDVTLSWIVRRALKDYLAKNQRGE